MKLMLLYSKFERFDGETVGRFSSFRYFSKRSLKSPQWFDLYSTDGGEAGRVLMELNSYRKTIDISKKQENQRWYRGQEYALEDGNPLVDETLMGFVSGTILMKIQSGSITENMVWASPEEVSLNSFIVEEVVVEMSSSQLEFSANILALRYIRELKNQSGNPDFYDSLLKSNLTSGFILPIFDKRGVVLGMLYIEREIDKNKFLCRYFSCSGSSLFEGCEIYSFSSITIEDHLPPGKLGGSFELKNDFINLVGRVC